MGLFDKIKDNAKNISVRSIEEVQQDGLMVAPESELAQLEDVAPSEEAQTEPATEEVIVSRAEEDQSESVPEVTEPEEPKEEPRKSKITEVPKTEVASQKTEQKETKKKDSTAPKTPTTTTKQLPGYQPHYKMKADAKPTEDAKPSVRPAAAPNASKPKVIDVTPAKPVENVKQAIYARERATLAVLANQRRMNGTVPLYATNHLRFKTRVFIDRIEYSGSFGKNVLPIERVAWVKLRAGGTGVIIETNDGKRVVMVVKPADRLDFADAVMKVQSLQPKREKFKDTKTVRLDQLDQLGEGIDELEKLAKLYEKGILTQDEFEAKKKQILNI